MYLLLENKNELNVVGTATNKQTSHLISVFTATDILTTEGFFPTPPCQSIGGKVTQKVVSVLNEAPRRE